MKIVSFLFASALICSSAWSAVENESNADAKALLDRMARAFRELNYDLSFVYIRDNQVEPMRFVHAFEQGRERSRLVHLNGPAREIIREDDSVMAYFAESKPLMLDKANSGLFTRDLLNDLSRVKDSYALKAGDSFRIAGRASQLLSLESLTGERYGYRIWLDQETGLLLRSELVAGNGQIVEQWQVIRIEIKDRVAEHDLRVGFEVNTHAGVRVLSSASSSATEANDKWNVQWLPTGFLLKSHQLQQRAANETPLHHLLFSDGVAAISIYVADMPSNVSLAERVWRRGGMTIFELSNTNRRVTVVGDIPANTAKKIAHSVHRNESPTP